MIRVEQGGELVRVVIDRPEKANALTRGMLAEIAEAARAAGRDAVRAFVLTGAGRVFSAGADLEDARSGLATDSVWEEVSGAIAALPCLTVAALNGTLAGGAFGMALACDIRICVPGAKLFYPVMKLGFLPQPSDPARLAALIGPARAKMILMCGAKVGAEEALAWGLVDRIAPEDGLAASVAEIAADALGAAPDHAAAIKVMIG